ncbi:MAG: HD domain-containing protein [Chloroflexi bacterium]|nr:HD domain-containing protein [Chloroflexota bacterium]
MVARRRGTWFDPTLVDALISTREDVVFWQRLVGDDPRAQLAALEPEERVLMADDACLDRIARAFAEVIDAESSWTFRHSRAVAEIAVGVGQVLGFSKQDLRQVERAALLHDMGKLGVSNRILDKPTGLTEQERAAMSRHAEYTQRILGRVASFRDVAALAGAHHERLDGQGYHRGIGAAELPMAARVIKVADICEALSVDRPYRPALAREEVFQIMGRDVGASICPEAFEALRVFLERDNPSPASAQPEAVDKGTLTAVGS